MRYTVFAVIGCLLFSCHQVTLPTEEMAFQKFLLKQGDKNSKLFEFKNFKKTAGVKKTILGQEIYEFDYHVQKLAKQDISKCQGMGLIYFLADSSIIADSIRQVKDKISHLSRPSVMQSYKKGELVQDLDGKIVFINKETGWQ